MVFGKIKFCKAENKRTMQIFNSFFDVCLSCVGSREVEDER